MIISRSVNCSGVDSTEKLNFFTCRRPPWMALAPFRLRVGVYIELRPAFISSHVMLYIMADSYLFRHTKKTICARAISFAVEWHRDSSDSSVQVNSQHSPSSKTPLYSPHSVAHHLLPPRSSSRTGFRDLGCDVWRIDCGVSQALKVRCGCYSAQQLNRLSCRTLRSSCPFRPLQVSNRRPHHFLPDHHHPPTLPSLPPAMATMRALPATALLQRFNRAP